MHTTQDRLTEALAARRERSARAQPAHLRLDPSGLTALQRAAGNAATGAVLARFRALARQPAEAKVRARAHELWERSGGGTRSREEDEAIYFEALRQVEIEERAHFVSKERGGHDPVANYYEAERQIAEERRPKPPVVEPKPAVVEPQPATPLVEAAKPLIEEAKPKEKYVPAHRREGFVPSTFVQAAPIALPQGVYYSDQLTRSLGFARKTGNHLQRDVRPWNGFDVHVSVYHDRGTFDELHVKFDLGSNGSAWFFFDTAGNLLRKTSTLETRKRLLRAAGCPNNELANGLATMAGIANDEARWVVSRLR